MSYWNDSPCPECGTITERVEATSGKVVEPRPGDITMCATCMTVSEWVDGKKLEAIDGKRWRDYIHPTDREALTKCTVLISKTRNEDNTLTNYMRAIVGMMRLITIWRWEHPGQTDSITFVAPAGAMVISTVEDAVEKGFIVANEPGMDLIRWLTGHLAGRQSPTILMLQTALKGLTNDKDENTGTQGNQRGIRPTGLA